MPKPSSNMKNSKNAEKHDIEEYQPSEESISSQTEEDDSEIITGINLRSSLGFNEFPNRLENMTAYENSMEKTSHFPTTYPYHKCYDVDNNLKTPVVVENYSSDDGKINQYVTNSTESSQDFTLDSLSKMISCFGSEDTSTCDLSESKLNNSSTFKNLEDKVESVDEEFENLEKWDQKSIQFYCLRSKVLAIMKPESIFWFCGKLEVQVLYGAIQIYGAVLRRSTTVTPAQVYSPRNHSLVGIETVYEPSECNEKELWNTLAQEGINRKIKSCLVLNVKQCQPGWAIFLLENLKNHLTTFLNAFCSFKLFPKIDDQTFYSWTDPKRAEVTLQATFRYCKAGKQLTINQEWRTKVVDKILNEYSTNRKSINLVFGGKGVGKSTFSKYLVNSILPKTGHVVLINLDPGQTEGTPSGCISLNLIDKPFLGPNFTQLRMPYYQLYIGDINVVNCVTRYLEGALKLANILSNDPKIAGLPVIVNTMGFCKGIGWDIAVSVILFFQPTNVIQIISKKLKNNFDYFLNKTIVQRQKFSWINWDKCDIERNKLSYDLVTITSEAEELRSNGETWNMEPYQKRDLVMLAYLSQITENKSINSYSGTTPSINDAVPYMVPLSSLYLSLTQTRVPTTHVLAAMNGNIVALCGFDPHDVSTNINSHSNSKKPQVLVRIPLSTCYGFGVVRGVEIEKGIVYLNTPLSPEILQFVNCLVDCIQIPSALLPLNLPNAPYTGNKVDLPTSQEPRRGYFRMRVQTAPSI